MTQQPTWRHHYIPEFYLKRWAKDNGRLIQFSKPYGNIVKSKPVYPRQTGFEDKLYVMSGLTEEASQIVEREFFCPIDTRASDVLAKMEQGIVDFSPRERVAWAQFLIMQALRTPEHVRGTINRMSELLENTTIEDEKRWKRQRRPSDPLTLKAAWKQPENRARAQRKALEAIMEVSNSEKIGTALISMTWGSLYLPHSAAALMTSDRPLQWFGPLKHKDFHVLMPVGPKRVFYATNNQELALRFNWLDAHFIVDFLNDHVSRRAVNFVYATTPRVIDFVQRTMGVNPEQQVIDRLLFPGQHTKRRLRVRKNDR